MDYPGSACRGTDLPSGRLPYIHTYIHTIAYSFVTLQDKNDILLRKRVRKKFPLLFEIYDDSVRDSDCFFLWRYWFKK